jgi:uncharacterized membrane protein
MQMEDTYTLSTTQQAALRVPAANVSSSERLVTLLAGAALLGYSWKNGSKSLGLISAGLLARGATGYCPAYAAMGVNGTDTRLALTGGRGIHIRESVTINAPADRIYRFWRQLDRLPEVMPHLAKVEQLDTKRSRWTARAFDQLPFTWNAEIINEVPFETIGWKTLPGEAIQNAGSVTFKPVPGNGGTEVRVHLQYAAPGGKAASWLAKVTGEDPARLTREGLLALKRHLELQTLGLNPPAH